MSNVTVHSRGPSVVGPVVTWTGYFSPLPVALPVFISQVLSFGLKGPSLISAKLRSPTTFISYSLQGPSLITRRLAAPSLITGTLKGPELITSKKSGPVVNTYVLKAIQTMIVKKAALVSSQKAEGTTIVISKLRGPIMLSFKLRSTSLLKKKGKI